jgi:hypothetical protein
MPQCDNTSGDVKISMVMVETVGAVMVAMVLIVTAQ